MFIIIFFKIKHEPILIFYYILLGRVSHGLSADMRSTYEFVL